MTFRSQSAGALLGGALCLTVLAGMTVGHAWPLWTGDRVTMSVATASSTDARRGESVQLTVPENHVYLGDRPEKAPRTAVAVKIAEGFWPSAVPDSRRWRSLRGEVVFVQLEPNAEGVLRGVSISRAPIAGTRNLRGRVVRADTDVVEVRYGIESLFVEQGSAPAIASALSGADARLEVALTSSGRARATAVMAGGRRW